MRRRVFITLIGGAVFAWQHVVKAQVAAKRPLVAVLVAASSVAAARNVSGFPQG
jgi:hypothetical protein